MFDYIQLKKSMLSYWLLLAFFIMLAIGASISEFFQNPILTTNDFNQYRFLFDKNELDNISLIKLENRLGSFEISKAQSDNVFLWNILKPRELPAKTDTVDSIIKTIESIKIKQVHTLDPINLSNFSLNKPLTKIILSIKDSEDITIKFGLINSIDNSTYVTVSDKEAVYHVEKLFNSLESISLSNFIESRVFPISINDLKTFELYRGNKLTNFSQLNFQYDIEQKQWTKNNKVLNSEKINSYLNKILNIKSHLILDKVSETLQKKIDKYLEKAIYSLRTVDKKGREIIYKISPIVHSLPDIKIEKRQNFIVSASNRSHPYIINKNNMPLFNKYQKEFKNISVKKLFY